MPKIPKPGDTGTVTHVCQEHVVVRMDDGALVTCANLREGAPISTDGYIASFESQGKGRVRIATMEPIRGPSKTSTPAYRNGWDRVFGRVNAKPPRAELN